MIASDNIINLQMHLLKVTDSSVRGLLGNEPCFTGWTGNYRLFEQANVVGENMSIYHSALVYNKGL